MSLLGAINNTMSGLQTIQTSMQVISGNVSNAQSPNYTKKSIVLEADVVSGGVRIGAYNRATNNSLTNLLQQSLGDNGLRSTQENYLNQIQSLLGSAQDAPTLTNAMSEFAAAWRQLSAAPEDRTQQQTVIFKGQNLAREVNRLASGLSQITVGLQNDITDAVDDLNDSLTQIKSYNDQIVAAQSNGQGATVNNLMDERDAQVQRLAALVNIRVFQRSQNTIGIYTPGGLSLLDNVPNQFSWNGTSITLNPGTTDVTAQLKGGKIEALAGLLDQGTSSTTLNDPGKASVYKIQDQLQKLVNLFITGGTFDTAYDGATTGTGELAADFFTGTTPSAFTVNANLLNGTSTLKEASASVIATDMDVATRTVAAAGLTVNNTDYVGYTDSIIGTHTQNTKTISDQAAIYKGQADDYTQRLQSSTGVNIDDEMALLIQLQNNYSAAAHVLNVIQQMFQVIQQTG
jgi:flagellar hook-associated protein 1 FlgK